MRNIGVTWIRVKKGIDIVKTLPNISSDEK
jgi:hypothetical protein